MTDPKSPETLHPEVIRAMQKEFGEEISAERAAELVHAVAQQIAKGLRKHRVVRIEDFGDFSVVRTQERVGVNPHTGEEIRVAGKTTISFEAAPSVEEALAVEG